VAHHTKVGHLGVEESFSHRGLPGENSESETKTQTTMGKVSVAVQTDISEMLSATSSTNTSRSSSEQGKHLEQTHSKERYSQVY